MSAAPVINPYEISMDELARLASQPAPTPEGVTPPSVEQPRDEQGRFIAAVPPQADPVAPPQADPVVDPAAPVEEYTATIDIGDGAGVQVFSAPTKDELLEKLIEAQTNATKKIRDLSARPPAAPVAPVALTVTTPNPDEELALSQEMLSEPTTAFRKLFEKQVGMPIDSFKTKVERLEAWERGQREESIAREWMAATPDYNAIPANGIKIGKWLELNRLEATAENLQAAYTDLNASGLLAPKAAAAPAAPTTPAAPAPRSSGISTRHSVAPVLPPTVADETKKAYEMPLDQLLVKAGGYRY
jgi:hypothetical protein